MTELMQFLGPEAVPAQTKEVAVQTLQLDEGTMNAIAMRVSRVVGQSHVVAQSQMSGARVLVPLEKTTGGAVSIRTAPHAVLHVPERDMEIYGRIREAIPTVARLAQDLNAFMTVDEETRRLIKACRNLAVDLQGEMERRLGS
jgi:L-alanine-DL-glutamate epimerase-like enolase superfamily enzyme